jgi:hypothetical protein
MRPEWAVTKNKNSKGGGGQEQELEGWDMGQR